MNAVSWSLSCEAFFYACFPIMVLVLRRLPAPSRWALAGVALVLALAAGLLQPYWAFHLPVVRSSSSRWEWWRGWPSARDGCRGSRLPGRSGPSARA